MSFRLKKERANIGCSYCSSSLSGGADIIQLAFFFFFLRGRGSCLSQSDPTQGSAFPELGLVSLSLSNSPTVSLRTPASLSHSHIKPSLVNGTLKIF